MYGTPQKTRCRPSQKLGEGLISLIGTYVLIVSFFRFLFEEIEEIIIEFGKSFECRRWSSASLFEDRKTPPVHTLCANGLTVGEKGDYLILVKLIDVSGC
jgi:hypothetical protein